MKRLFTVLVTVLLTAALWAQNPPQKMSYQAVIRDPSNHLVTTQVGMQISILQGSESGPAVYIETQTPTPNQNGLITIEIGTGTTTDDFSAINWAAGPYFIKTATAVEAPLTTYTIEGISQILSVPYALHAKSVASYTETDPEVKAINGIVKSNGTIISAAVASDFPILNQNTTGNAATAGTVTETEQPNITSLGTLTSLVVSGTTTVPTPVNATDAANKAYVDLLISNTETMQNSLILNGLITKDIDGNVYGVVTIGTQKWMTENLKTTKYRNGDLIGTTIPATLDIRFEAEPKYQWAFNGDENNVTTYGRLYTWYAITDSRNVCPTGWHVPTDTEWTTLEDYLIASGYNYDGTTLGDKTAKSLASTTLWTTDSGTGTPGNTDYPDKRNVTGFTALPGGYRSFGGTFEDLTVSGHWWSSSVDDSFYAWYRQMYYYSIGVFPDHNPMWSGFSVRCLKD